MFAYRRQYCGPVRAVIVDLAGTIVDYGSRAPAGVFEELFRRNGVQITTAQAREPMGMHKRAHIQAVTAMPAVAEKWLAAHGSACTEADIDRMYDEFVPLQLEALPQHTDGIPGALELLSRLQDEGIGIATTTGYNREMAQVVLDSLARQGFEPDAAVCAADVPAGRPAPWMIFRAMELLGVYPPDAVVSIGDTLADVESALNAGVWSVGAAKTGNMLALSQAEMAALSEGELQARLDKAYATLHQAGAHFVVDGVADCCPVLERIHELLRRAGVG